MQQITTSVEVKLDELENCRRAKAEIEKTISALTKEIVSEVGYGKFQTAQFSVSIVPVEKAIFDRPAFVAVLGEEAYKRFTKTSAYDFITLTKKKVSDE